MAEQERRAAVSCADAIRASGLPCPVVSGVHAHRPFRPQPGGRDRGARRRHVFFDLVMAGLGVCQADDIAASVLTTVIGHQAEKGWILVDAGWMAMSRDRGTAKQPVDQLYGLVCDAQGRPYPDLLLAETNQEQGIIVARRQRRDLAGSAVGHQTAHPAQSCLRHLQHEAYSGARSLARGRRALGTFRFRLLRCSFDAAGLAGCSLAGSRRHPSRSTRRCGPAVARTARRRSRRRP